jgi:hypothetical protein
MTREVTLALLAGMGLTAEQCERIVSGVLAVGNQMYADGYAAGREEMREEAAKVADFGVQWSPEPDRKTVLYISESCSRIAAAIRALPIEGTTDE